MEFPPSEPDDWYDPAALDALGDIIDPIREKARALKLFNAADLARTPAPPRRWLVPDMIPAARTTLLYANGGEGKSLLALQFGVATVTATDWIGTMPEPGPALYLSCEDDVDEIHRRLEDIIAGRDDIDKDELARLHIVDLAGEDALLATADRRRSKLDPTSLFVEIEKKIAEIRPIAVCVDTLADTFGGDEIAREQVRQFIGMLNGLAIKYDCAIIVLAHPSLSGMASGAGTSGSTGWSNSVRSRLYLAPVKGEEGAHADPALKTLTVMKANYGPTGESISLKWERGRFVLASGAKCSPKTKAEIDQIFLDLLKKFTKQGRNVVSSTGKSYAPAEFAAHADSQGISKTAFKLAMDRLLNANRIKIEWYGPPSTRRSRLILVEESGDEG